MDGIATLRLRLVVARTKGLLRDSPTRPGKSQRKLPPPLLVPKVHPTNGTMAIPQKKKHSPTQKTKIP